MKLRSWILLVLLTALGFALFLFLGTGSFSSELSGVFIQDSPAALSRFEAGTLSFVDPIAGYAFRYPVGYLLEVEEGKSAVFYAPGPSGFSESFVLTTTTQTLDPRYLESLVQDEFLNARKVSQSRVRVNGKAAWRLQYFAAAPGLEDLHVVQGSVPCGALWLYFVATIPDSLREDVELADYVLYSLSCPA